MKIINIIILTLVFVSPLKADQFDLRLESLFEELQKENNQKQHDIFIMEIWKIWLETNDQLIDKDFNIALNLMAKNKYQESIIYFSRVIEKKPNFAEAWNKRATAYYAIGDFEKSILDINQTLYLEPRHFGAMDGLGLIFFKLQRYTDSIMVYNEMLRILPFSIDVKNKINQIKNFISEDI